MEKTFHIDQRVGEIVAAFPGASNLFKAHGIDFCCGGGQKLGDALRGRGIPEASFMRELERSLDEDRRRSASTETDWRAASYTELIDQIVSVHHAFLRIELPLLMAFTSKIAHVHGGRHPELVTLSRLFLQFQAELQTHMTAEETELFPLILAYEKTGARSDLGHAVASLDRLEAEHESVGQLLASMRELTAGYLLPGDACRTYTLSFQKLEALESDMFMHIHLENNILFTRLREAHNRT